MLEWETRRLGMRVLGLACTCRRIYVEVIPLLYTVPTFVMNSVCTLPWWKDTLLPFRFDSVRSLRLRFLLLPTRQDPDFVQHPESKFSSNAASRLADDMWRNTWNVVAQMIGLRKLRVMLDTMPATVDPAVEMEVLEPLCEVRGIEDYVVLLAWNLDTETISEATKKDMPFRFVRSTGITTN